MTITNVESARQALGLSSEWVREDREAVESHHRSLFRDLKKHHGVQSPADIPGFISSIQHLHDYGYSLTDIGAIVGVTRERVRQWFDEYDELERLDDIGGGPRSTALYRLWSDELNCFVPITDEELIEAANRRREALDRRHLKHRVHGLLTHLRDLADRLGRTPSMFDINDCAPPWHTDYVNYFGSISKAQELAGLEPAKVGGAGHRT